MLSKETYDYLDKANAAFPSQNIEIRFMEDKAYLYVNGKEQFWVTGNSNHMDRIINYALWGVLLGIGMSNKENSLKNKLDKL